MGVFFDYCREGEAGQCYIAASGPYLKRFWAPYEPCIMIDLGISIDINT